MLSSSSTLYNRHGGGGGDPFIDAYLGYASSQFPRSMQAALLWAERMVLADGTYMSALQRIVSYFITDINVVGEVSEDEKRDYKEFLIDGLGIKEILTQIGLEYFVYGNSFPSFVVPFTRHLACKRCHAEAPLKQVVDSPVYRFKWRKYEFEAACPRCGYQGPFDRIDRNSTRREDLRVVNRSPHEIQLVWDPFTDHIAYYWRLPEYYKETLTARPGRTGEILPAYQLERAPWAVIEAVRSQRHVLFSPSFLFHVKDRTLSGVLNRGWGIPRPLSNFRQAYYVQLLRRMNEALALDYVIPVRLISPAAGGTGMAGDPILNSNLGSVGEQFAAIVEHKRRDPASWHFFPFPVEYQMLGGEANQLAPSQLIELGHDHFLNAVGVPVDFYRGSLTLQNTPTAARLFESYHSHLLHHFNRFLDWLSERLAETMNWDRVKIRLARPSHFDDINRQLTKLQLAGQGFISQSTGLQALDLTFEDEQKKMLAEQQYVAREAGKAQEDQQQEQMGPMMADPNAMAGQGAAPPAGPTPGSGMPAAAGMMSADPVGAVLAKIPVGTISQMSPQDIRATAAGIAQDLNMMPESLKDSALIQIKQRSPDMHLYVKEQLAELRRQQQQNAAMLRSQAGQPGPQQPPTAPPPTF